MWMMVMFVPMLLVLGVLFALMIAGTFKWTPRSAKPRASLEPACGRCGYLVRGIPSFTCPECGSDLREAGIDAGKRAGGAGWLAVIGLVIVWSACMWIAGGLIDNAIVDMTPVYGSTSDTTTLGYPKSQAYREVRITRLVTFPEPRTSINDVKGTIELELITLDAQRFVLSMDITNGTPAFARKENLNVPISGVVIQTWLASKGIKTDDRTQQEANEIALALSTTSGNAAISGGIFGTQGLNSSMSSGTRSTKAPAAVNVILFVLWFFGAYWIAKRYAPHRSRA